MTSPEAAETKCIITSLLTSSPLRCTIRQLCRDFANLVGYEIPVQKLGFTNVEEYLRSIPDTVHVYGSGPNAEVQGIIKPKSAHINEMVTKQKKPKRGPPPRRGPPIHQVNYGRAAQHQPYFFQYQPPGVHLDTIQRFFQHVTHLSQIQAQYNQARLHHNANKSQPGTSEEINEDNQHRQHSSLLPEIKHEINTDNSAELPPSPSTSSSEQIKIKHELKTDNREELPPSSSTSTSEQTSLVSKNDSEKECDKSDESQETEFKTENSISLEKEEIQVVERVYCVPSDVETESELSAHDVASLNDDTYDLEFEDHTSKVPLKVQNNLKQLITHYPNGIWCTQLPSEYKKMFDRTLSYERYDYRSLIELCLDLPEIFQYVQPTPDDFLLYDKTKPIPPVKVGILKKDADLENVATKHILDELPKLDWSAGPSVIPKDAMCMLDEIPRFFPANVGEKEILDITVGEIFDLSKFWVYMTFGGLEELMKDLQLFFEEHENEYRIPEALLEEGLYCVAVYMGQFHRCVLVKMLPQTAGLVRVLFIDYGTVENVFVNELWFLPKRFGKLPCQAIRARLANIYPPQENRPWSAKAIAKFQRLVIDRVVVARIIKIDIKDHVLEVYLADITNENNIFYLNDVLVKEGYALYTDQDRKKAFIDYDCTPIVTYLHLCPEFWEIESGQAPTVQEMKYIIANKIPAHHYLPQYFDIYYYEDVDYIERRHERVNLKRVNDIPIQVVEEDFDFSVFADSLADEINNHLRRGGETDKSKVTGELKSKNPVDGETSVKEYFCNKKRISELIHGNTSKSSDSNCDNCDSDVRPLSALSDSLDFSIEVTPLNNSLKHLNLNDSSIINNSAKSPKSTNPFLSDEFLNDSNPFRSTNPFLSDLSSDLDEPPVNTNELFGFLTKPTESKLTEKIVNNLNDLNSCACKMTKQVNIEKSNLTNPVNISLPNNTSKSDTQNPFKTFEKNEINPDPQPRRIRTPPGFKSETMQNRMGGVPPPMGSMPNYYNFSFSNPYYQRFPVPPQLNTFFTQNQLSLSLAPPIVDNYLNFVPPVAPMYPNSFNFNMPNWSYPPQTYQHRNYKTPP